MVRKLAVAKHKKQKSAKQRSDDSPSKQPKFHKYMKYSDELAEAILDRVRDGETLKKISKDSTMPCKGRLYDWAANHETFSPLYIRARRAGLMKEADSIIAIADNGKNDWMEKQGRNGTFIALNHEHVSRSKLRIEVRQWLLSRLISETFGNKVDVSNKDGSLADAFSQAASLANGSRT